MKRVRTIYYVGSDAEFFKELESSSTATFKEIKLMNDLYKKGNLTRVSLDHCPNVVLIDFTSQDLNATDLCNEILLLKRTHTFKGCHYVGLFADVKQLDSFSQIFTLGFQMSFVKGQELDALIRDIFYIGFGDNPGFPRYARAKNISKPLEIGICSTISCLTNERLILETDLELMDGALNFELPFFPDLNRASFKVRNQYTCSKHYPMNVTYNLEFPFPDPWASETEGTILQDTVETWIDLNKASLDHRCGIVKVINSNVALLSDFEEMSSLQLFIDFSEKVPDNSLADLNLKRPYLIFYELDDEGNGENSFDSLSQLIFNVNTMEEFYPVIVVTNCKSSGVALQKLFNYQFITAISTKLEKKVFQLLTESFIKNKISKNAFIEKYYFAPHDERRKVDLRYNFTITSLTEHEVTFLSDIELPMFSVLHFNLPLEFYGTIVPAFFKMEYSGKGHHYMAIIHGMEENRLKMLRQFIYQIIYKPLEDFKAETIAATLSQMKSDKPAPTSNEVVEEEVSAVSEPTPQTEEKRIMGPVRNFKLNGKSKL